MNSLRPHAIAADHVFDGTVVREHTAVVVDGARIVDLVATSELPRTMLLRALPDDAWLAPGFIDLQVNGGGDVLFNDQPTVEGIRSIAAAHRKFGTTGLLPTLISDSAEKMRLALDAASAAASEEGGVRVSLGHSMASYRQTRAAMAEGLTGFTHLFNAMRPLSSREGGPIAQALESPDAWYGLIVDGVHVDPAMLRLALRGLGHPMLVTDAMPPVGGSSANFSLHGKNITARDGYCVTDDGTLAGTVLDMAAAVRNCIRLLGVALPDALRFASAHPATFLGLEHMLGKLAPGYRADLVAFDPNDITVLATWVAGRDDHSFRPRGPLGRS